MTYNNDRPNPNDAKKEHQKTERHDGQNGCPPDQRHNPEKKREEQSKHSDHPDHNKDRNHPNDKHR